MNFENFKAVKIAFSETHCVLTQYDRVQTTVPIKVYIA